MVLILFSKCANNMLLTIFVPLFFFFNESVSCPKCNHIHILSSRLSYYSSMTWCPEEWRCHTIPPIAHVLNELGCNAHDVWAFQMKLYAYKNTDNYKSLVAIAKKPMKKWKNIAPKTSWAIFFWRHWIILLCWFFEAFEDKESSLQKKNSCIWSVAKYY